MPTVLEQLHSAMNEHDLEAMLRCFDPNYRSEQPIHPNRGFGGKEQVRKNWSAIFESFPDFEADLFRHAVDGGTVWSEWHWTATGLNMAGVTLLGVEEDRIVWGSLYMEPVEEDGGNIDEAVQRMTAGGRQETDQSEEARDVCARAGCLHLPHRLTDAALAILVVAGGPFSKRPGFS